MNGKRRWLVTPAGCVVARELYCREELPVEVTALRALLFAQQYPQARTMAGVMC